jgi:hypothetical protein
MNKEIQRERKIVVEYKKYLEQFSHKDFYDKFSQLIANKIQPIPTYGHFKDLFETNKLRIKNVNSLDL